MCGIAGIIDPRSALAARAEAVARMCQAMVHRGPDDEGIESRGAATLGMRRLAIFDPANGHQPMLSPDGRLTLVFNGAIYNFRALRDELAASGWAFRTNCDTEVLLAAYARWGEQCLGRLRGMFAFAVWDEREQSLFLARDPFGIKPLYYRHEGARLLFASELNAMCAAGVFAAEIDPLSVADYLAWFAVPAPRTIYRDTFSLRPGECATFHAGRGALDRRARSAAAQDLRRPAMPRAERPARAARAMKLCQIVPSLEARHGGPSISTYALSSALARLGHEVQLLATQPGPAEERTDGPLRVRIFHRDWPQALCPSAGLREAVRASDAGIIHHHSIWLRTLHYAHRRAADSGAKFVVSPRGMMSTWAWRHHAWRKKIARALIHPGALAAVDGWHATSTEEEHEIRALGFHQPVCVAPNGVEEPDAAASARAAAHWLTACPAVGKQPVALFYSRLHQKKRVLELIDLWLERAPRDWLLLVVGIPQDYTPEMLERYVMRASGAGRVRVFSGLDRPPPYTVASLFLLPSHNENFGLVVAEAMAHGVPALVTDTTPWSELNTEARGWCVPWSEYATALLTATAEGSDRLRERGRRAREWVLREFAWEKSARTLAGFYEQLNHAHS